MKEKSTSLFFSDIVGYSSLFSSNEKLALNLLEEHDIIAERHIAKYKGKIIKRIGDAIFAEFSSAKNNYYASINIQKELIKRNKILSNENKIEVRIGLHYGNVYENNGDLFGNNVNICSRLESIAFPTSIACSQEFIVELQDLKIYNREYGFIALKNIKKPIKVFKIYNDQKHYLSENKNIILDFISNRSIILLDNDNIEKEFIPIGFLYPKNLGDIYTIDKSADNDFLSIEINKQLIDFANKISIIRTPSFETMIDYKDKDLQEIALELSLEYLLQSTIMRDDDSFKIYFTLFSINSAENIYDKKFEGKFHDMKNIIGSLLIDLSDLLNFKISPEQIKIFNAELNVNNDAYRLYLEGKNLSQINSSPDSLEKSKLKLKQSINIDDQFAEAYAALGMTYIHLGENDEAEECFDEAEDIIEDCENLDTLSIVYNDLGIYNRVQGKIKKSIRNFEKSLKSIKKLNDQVKLGNIYTNIAAAYSIINENELALNLSSRAELIFKELDEKIRLGSLYGTMGNINKNIGKLEEAIKYYNLAKKIFLSEDMIAKYAQVLIIQAECYYTINNIKNALQNLNEVKQIADDFNMPMLNSRYSLLMAMINFNNKKYNEALDFIDESIDIFDEINNKIKLASSQLLKIRILLKVNKLKKATKIYKKVERLIERLDDNKLSEDLEQISKLINI